MFARLQSLYHNYPRAFWIYNIVVFIDRFGGFMLYPFFALYLTKRFNLGMSGVGALFAVFSISGFVGSALGGALTDRMGRKSVILFSLVMSSLSALGMGLAPSLEVFALVSVVVGTLSNIGHPAHEAVVADLLPENRRAEGYGIIRVVFNLAVIIAPAAAGLLIARSYILLFVVDAAISLLAAAIVLLALPETKPAASAHTRPESLAQTFAGYGRVFKDGPFVAFVAVSIMLALVYMNMNTTLGVFLRDQHALPEAGYGSLLSLNAILVVICQFWIARRLEKYKPMLMLAVGAALYAVGFALYGFVSTYLWFALAMVVITVGEMIITPFQQATVARFAPEAMRGRYMAIAGLSWGIAFAAGPYLAGLMLDSADPNRLWLACGLLGLAAMLGYVVLDKVHHSAAPGTPEVPGAPEALAGD
jgi:predicted MFS family arabinose efflux permease